jgi:hypothetical protein
MNKHTGNPRLIMRVLPILLILATVAVARAQVTYSYIGNPYNPKTFMCKGTYIPCAQLSITGSFTVPEALAPNLVNSPEGLPFQSSVQSDEVLSEAEYSESIYKGFINGLCEASATFCNRREAQAVLAEFEEKQRNNPKNWSQLRQNLEAFMGIKKLVTDIRERFLRDAAILRIESREGVCDRLTHNSDQNGALNHPYKVASAGFTEWMENLGKFAAGHVMTLARMAPRPYRLAFLVDPGSCPAELLDFLAARTSPPTRDRPICLD